MRAIFKFVIKRPGIFFPVALMLMVLNNIRAGPLAEVAGVLGGLIVGTLAHHYWLSADIERAASEERAKTIEQIMEFKRFGLHRVSPKRDLPTDAWSFLSRIDMLCPKTHISIVGITARHMAVEKREDLRNLLRKQSNLHIQVCILKADSIHALARAKEMDRPTGVNIEASTSGWLKLASEFPGQIEVRHSDAIHYVEIEGYDLDLEAEHSGTAYLYLTPVPYKVDTNDSPSFLIKKGRERDLFKFWATRMREVWKDAREVRSRT